MYEIVLGAVVKTRGSTSSPARRTKGDLFALHPTVRDCATQKVISWFLDERAPVSSNPPDRRIWCGERLGTWEHISQAMKPNVAEAHDRFRIQLSEHIDAGFCQIPEVD